MLQCNNTRTINVTKFTNATYPPFVEVPGIPEPVQERSSGVAVEAPDESGLLLLLLLFLIKHVALSQQATEQRWRGHGEEAGFKLADTGVIALVT